MDIKAAVRSLVVVAAGVGAVGGSAWAVTPLPRDLVMPPRTPEQVGQAAVLYDDWIVESRNVDRLLSVIWSQAERTKLTTKSVKSKVPVSLSSLKDVPLDVVWEGTWDGFGRQLAAIDSLPAIIGIDPLTLRERADGVVEGALTIHIYCEDERRRPGEPVPDEQLKRAADLSLHVVPCGAVVRRLSHALPKGAAFTELRIQGKAAGKGPAEMAIEMAGRVSTYMEVSQLTQDLNDILMFKGVTLIYATEGQGAAAGTIGFKMTLRVNPMLDGRDIAELAKPG